MVFSLLILSYSNCSDINLKQPPKVKSQSNTIDPEIIDPGYKSTPTDYPDPVDGLTSLTFTNSAGQEIPYWQHSVSNLCSPFLVSAHVGSGIAAYNPILARDYKNPPCPTGSRPPFELVNGCRVYDRDSILNWSVQVGIPQSTDPNYNKLWNLNLNANYITGNVPNVVQHPFETVSIRIKSSEFFKQAGAGQFISTVSLYEDVKALISVTTTAPCLFKKTNPGVDFCQVNNQSTIRVASAKSDPAYLNLVRQSGGARCLVEDSEYVYVNIRFILQQDLEKPNSSTCTQQYCGYAFMVRPGT